MLIFVDRRIRESEIRQVQDFPKRFDILTLLVFLLSNRQFRRYARAFLASLESVLVDTVEVPTLKTVLADLDSGFVLLGGVGTGKTTLMQMAAAHKARDFLEAPRKHKLPVLFPLRRWLFDRTLEQAIQDHVSSYAPVSRRALRNALTRGQLIVIFDEVNEVFDDHSPNFDSQFEDLRQKFPRVAWTLSSGDMPVPTGLKLVDLSPPTDKEIREILRRRRSK